MTTTVAPDLTDDVVAKIRRTFANHGANANGGEIRDMARALFSEGVALVDTTRNTFLVDMRVHEGVLYRSALHRRRAEQLDAWLAHVTPSVGVWRRLSQRMEETL